MMLGGQWLRFAIQLGSMAALARLLEPGDFGVVSMVMAIAGIATLIGDFGLSMASIQSKELSNTQRSNLFWINAALGALLGGVVFMAAGPLAAFYGRPELVAVTQSLATVFLLNALAAQFRAEASRRLQFRWLAFSDVAAQLIAMVVAIQLALTGFGYWSLVAQQVTVAAVNLPTLVLAARWLPGLPTRHAGMGTLLQFGANTAAVQLVNYLSSNVDSILIGRLYGPTALGLYDRAFQMFRLPLMQVAAPMTRVAFPILSRIDDDPTFDRYIQRAQMLVAYVMGGAFFVAILMADPLVEIVLGPGWDTSKTIFRILAVGGIFQSISYTYYWVFLAKAKTGVQLRFSLIARSLMVALMIAGTIWGPLGVAVGSSLGLACNWLILTSLAIPKTGVATRGLVQAALRPVAILAGMVGSAWVLSMSVPRPSGPWAELAVMATAIILCGLLVLAACRPARSDLVALWQTVGKIRRSPAAQVEIA